VPGQAEDAGVLDLGLGLAPDALSAGLGGRLLPSILRLAAERADGRGLRTAIAAWNERSLRLCRSAGFAEAATFPGPRDTPFVELRRPPGS
jgi:ribosomal-protein-alanine N-acetyltransferase